MPITSPWRNIVAATAAFLCLTGGAQADDVGKIIHAVGEVRLDNGPAQAGDTVRTGHTLATGANGYLYIKTIDGGFLILRPASAGRVVDYHVDGAQPHNSRFKIELERGIARSVSGDAVKDARQNFRFNTPVAAIGVRGTDFTVFTDEHTTRVAVLSGAIVVSGFDGSCSPGGSGPCEAASARELSAAQNGSVLQVVRGQAVPQLLQGSAYSPDAAAPPRSDEPGRSTGASAARGTTTTVSANSNIDPNYSPIKLANLDKMAPETMPPLPEPAIPPIVWGRWQALANLPATIDASTLAAEYQRVAMDSYFLLLRSKESSWQAPASGSVNFALQGSQALVQNGTAVSPASLENGKLLVNFSTRQFATQFDLLTQGQRYARQAEGNVFSDGTFGNFSQFLGNNNMLVQGALTNNPALRAAYLFQSRLDDNRVAYGATSWAK